MELDLYGYIFIVISVLFFLVLISLFINKINEKIFFKKTIILKIMFYISISSFFAFALLAIYLKLYENLKNILWYIVLYILLMIIIFIILKVFLLPIKYINDYSKELATKSKLNDIYLSGSIEFNSIEKNFKRIILNFKEYQDLIKERENVYHKFFPYKYMSYLNNNKIETYTSGYHIQVDKVILFCDIRDSSFTSLTLSLEEYYTLINSYLSKISDIISKHNGFVDKFMGDGVLAIFDDAIDAINTGNEIASYLTYVSPISLGVDKLNFGISIDCGKVVVGVVGHGNTLAITSISNVVNNVSKIQKLNRLLDTKVIFTKQVLNTLPDEMNINYRYIGSHKCDYYSEFSSLFESVDWLDEMSKKRISNYYDIFESAVRMYDKGQYKKAVELFNKCLENNNNDLICVNYIELCKKEMK